MIQQECAKRRKGICRVLGKFSETAVVSAEFVVGFAKKQVVDGGKKSVRQRRPANFSSDGENVRVFTDAFCQVCIEWTPVVVRLVHKCSKAICSPVVISAHAGLRLNTLTAETILQSEKVRMKTGHGPAEFYQFGLGCVNFQSRQLDQLSHFFQQRRDILEMSEKAFGVFESFAAMGLVAIETESVVEDVGLTACFLYDALAKVPERFELSGRNSEIGNDGTAGVVGWH
jgi:hypothetical protein